MSQRKNALFSVLISAAIAGSSLSTTAADSPGLSLARQLNDAFVSVAEDVSPAVVVINVTEKARRGRIVREEEGEGSGIIVSADGYILTNNHVVDGADTITVTLKDGREFPGEVKGTDPKTDLAVVKIKPGDVKLTVARLGDSDKLRVGEFVVAIGHPYELNYSVTVGHVSALQRLLPTDSYDVAPSDDDPEYIQTDAVINPGNSGGPLINLDGEVIGVNAMIEADTVPYSQIAISRGIGLAIPINLAKAVKDRLISDGKLTRSMIGIGMSETSGQAVSFLPVGTKPNSGVLVSQVIPDGPSEKAGLKVGDIILAVDGVLVRNGRELRGQVSFKRPGETISINILRDNKPRTIKVTTEPDTEVAVETAPSLPTADPEADYGFVVRDLTKDLAKKFGLDTSAGVVVTDVQPGSPAYNKDIAPGDLIIKMNNVLMTNANEFTAKLRALAPSQQWTMTLDQATGTNHFKVLRAPSQ